MGILVDANVLMSISFLSESKKGLVNGVSNAGILETM